jgi:hypothetical protein
MRTISAISLFSLSLLSSQALAQVVAQPYISANARVQANGAGPLNTKTFDTGEIRIPGLASAGGVATADISILQSGGVFEVDNRSFHEARFGVLKALARSKVTMSSDFAFAGAQSRAEAWTLASTPTGASFLDTISVGGVTPGSLIRLTITASLDGFTFDSGVDSGTTSGVNSSAGSLSVASTAGGATLINVNGTDGRNDPFSFVQTFTTDVTVGTDFQIQGILNASALSSRSTFAGVSSAIFSSVSTGRVSISSSNPSVTISSASGFNYAPVPEPATVTVMGFAVLGLLKRLKKS